MILKRLFDLAAASVALLLLSPVFLAIGLLIKLESRGTILYKARRIGRAGRLFRMYKFRTTVGVGRPGAALTYNDNSRITRIGRFLHETGIEELPQLLNVLKGEMSLVGPKPEPHEYARPEQYIWRQVLSVRPGIRGLAQFAFAVDRAELLDNQATLDRDYMTRVLSISRGGMLGGCLQGGNSE